MPHLRAECFKVRPFFTCSIIRAMFSGVHFDLATTQLAKRVAEGLRIGSSWLPINKNEGKG